MHSQLQYGVLILLEAARCLIWAHNSANLPCSRAYVEPLCCELHPWYTLQAQNADKHRGRNGSQRANDYFNAHVHRYTVGGTWVVIKKCSLDCCNCAERRAVYFVILPRSITAGHAFLLCVCGFARQPMTQLLSAKRRFHVSESARVASSRMQRAHTLGIYGMIKVKDYLSTRHPHSTVVYFADAHSSERIRNIHIFRVTCALPDVGTTCGNQNSALQLSQLSNLQQCVTKECERTQRGINLTYNKRWLMINMFNFNKKNTAAIRQLFGLFSHLQFDKPLSIIQTFYL